MCSSDLCCDSLEQDGLQSFPLGLQGITQYFDFYIRALTRQVERRMQLDSRQRIVERAISAFVERLVEKWPSFVSVADAIPCFESILPSIGNEERSLLSQLEHEGILTVEVVPIRSTYTDELVRFTFERFGDFQIALNLLERQQAAGHAISPLGDSSPLRAFFKIGRAHV